MHPQDAQFLARSLMRQHGLTDWSFGWSNAKRTAGTCSYRNHRITLSKPLITEWSERAVRNTILHEIAHALAGPYAKHGPAWKRQARAIGCTGDRCWTPGEDSPAVPPTWIGTCPNGHTSGRYRKPTAVSSCGKCSRRYDARFHYKWERAAA